MIAEGTYKISRAELGRMGWTMLHMITGSFPEEIPEDMRKKFNAFLGLFSHLYPCKLCAKHFIELLKEVGQF